MIRRVNNFPCVIKLLEPARFPLIFFMMARPGNALWLYILLHSPQQRFELAKTTMLNIESPVDATFPYL